MSVLAIVLLVVLVLMLAGSVPAGRSYGWGYYPSGAVGLVLLIVLILVLLGHL